MKRKEQEGGSLEMKRITTSWEFAQYKDQLINLYIKCFAEYPWNENYTYSKVEQWFNSMLKYENLILLICTKANIVLGATFCFPAGYQQEISDCIPVDIKKENVIYLAETFVDSDYRRKGIATLFHDEKIGIAKEKAFEYVIETTSANSKMFPLMKKRGFEVINKKKRIVTRLIKGQLIKVPDERVIFFKKL
jgi:GNAT superfamily N-acetyltransferase